MPPGNMKFWPNSMNTLLPEGMKMLQNKWLGETESERNVSLIPVFKTLSYRGEAYTVTCFTLYIFIERLTEEQVN